MKFLKKKSNLLYLLLLVFIAYQKFPVFKNNSEHESKTIQSREVRVYGKKEKMIFPPNDRAIAIFWTSWCGPCKIEMKRLKKSVNDGNIPREKIFAINTFESSQEIQKFLKNSSYPFIFIDSMSLRDDLNVMATPTMMFLEQRKIISMSSGISLWGIWRAEAFF